MTRERAKELAPIIKAYGEGKRIQSYCSMDNIWVDCLNPTWHDAVQYRIAPEPRRRPMTRDEVLDFLAEYPNALVQLDNERWSNTGRHDFSFPISCYSYCLVENGVRSEPRKFDIEEGSNE